jgi:hypothetical protein
LKGEDEIAKGAAKGLENLHLVTYQLHKGEYRDHGPVFYENGERPLYDKKAYPAEMLDFNKFKERNKCRNNDQVCTEAVWIPQNVLLAEKSDMDAIRFAIEKIYENAEKINNSI